MVPRPPLACLLALLGSALAASAARAELPPEEQAELFKHILRYDRTLADPERARVLVLAAPGDARAAALAGAFSRAGLSAQLVTDPDLPGAEASVVYVAPGAGTAMARAVAEVRHMLTITAIPGLVERGAVSVALREGQDGRREVLVNSTRAYLEGQVLLAPLLSVARVYRAVVPEAPAEVVDRVPDDLPRPVRLAGEVPAYSREALEANVEGMVTAQCALDAEGRLRGCRVLKGVPFMDEPVLQALETWRFTPVIRDGHPLAVRSHTVQLRLVAPRR